MNGDRRLRNVIIVGGGTAGWMAAAAYGRFLGGQSRITLVESDAIASVGVGEATIPTIVSFNRMLGIDEAAFLRATGGTFKLGIEFHDWGRPGDRYLHPFSQYGQSLQGIQFHHIWKKLRDMGRADPLEAYSLCAAAAAEGRFAHEGGDSRSPFARPDYAYHFDATLYARFLRRYAEGLGVNRIEGTIETVERDGESGFVTAVRLEGGTRVAGDLFIDCSGFRSLLLGEELGVGFEDWSHWLPCNRAVAVASAPSPEPLPYTRALARPAGWQWRIPLQHRTGNGHVYSDRFMAPEAAEAMLMDTVSGTTTDAPRHLSFTAGRRTRFWEKNVVAIGLSGGFLEPLESTGIHLIQTGISKLMALMPDRDFARIERDTYNRLMARSFDGVRDFLILHYAATQRDDTPFWRHVGAMDLPDSLVDRIALFRSKGRFFRYDDELFDTANWVAVMCGQNCGPSGYDPIVDSLDPDRLQTAMKRIGGAIGDAVARMPAHGDYVRRYCAMPGTGGNR